MQVSVVNQPIEVIATGTDGQIALVSVDLPPVVSASILGMQGASGISQRFVYTQASPALVWTINHNLGYMGAAAVYSVGGIELEAEVFNASINQTIVTFLVATAGTAVIT